MTKSRENQHCWISFLNVVKHYRGNKKKKSFYITGIILTVIYCDEQMYRIVMQVTNKLINNRLTNSSSID